MFDHMVQVADMTPVALPVGKINVSVSLFPDQLNQLVNLDPFLLQDVLGGWVWIYSLRASEHVIIGLLSLHSGSVPGTYQVIFSINNQ